jgi:hypothetical protein
LNCNPILVIELMIRAAPERTAGGAYGYRGGIELVLTGYALNELELAVVRGEIERDVLVERDALREVVGVSGPPIFVAILHKEVE